MKDLSTEEPQDHPEFYKEVEYPTGAENLLLILGLIAIGSCIVSIGGFIFGCETLPYLMGAFALGVLCFFHIVVIMTKPFFRSPTEVKISLFAAIMLFIIMIVSFLYCLKLII